MNRVVKKAGVYSKKNGMVYRNIKVFEGTFEECQAYVMETYGKVLEKGETFSRNGFLSREYITIK
jgi:hypothetical protein